MGSSVIPRSDDTLVELLRARGQRVTSQRLVILRELRRRERHTTVEGIREQVAHDLPGISLPTVYATLDLLVELDLVRKLDVGSGVALYDGRTDPHEHTVCRRCGRVDDLDAGFDAAPMLDLAREAGFEPDRASVVVSGVCAACAAAR